MRGHVLGVWTDKSVPIGLCDDTVNQRVAISNSDESTVYDCPFWRVGGRVGFPRLVELYVFAAHVCAFAHIHGRELFLRPRRGKEWWRPRAAGGTISGFKMAGV